MEHRLFETRIDIWKHKWNANIWYVVYGIFFSCTNRLTSFNHLSLPNFSRK